MIVIDEAIELYDAHIVALVHKVKDGAVRTKISCMSHIGTELAKKLGCYDLIYLNDVSRGGFTSIELDVMIPVFSAVFECDGLKQTLHINGDQVDGFQAEQTKDGMRLKFKMLHHGSPHETLAYLIQVGTAQGICKITPMQKTLDLPQQTTTTLQVTDKDGNTSTTVIPPEMMQTALLTHKEKATKKGGGKPN